jgi:hypothetical protein
MITKIILVVMTNTNRTLEITGRTEFAAFIRAARIAGTFRSYGRLGRFGRSLITTDYCLTFPMWTRTPPMNIHRS